VTGGKSSWLKGPTHNAAYAGKIHTLTAGGAGLLKPSVPEKIGPVAAQQRHDSVSGDALQLHVRSCLPAFAPAGLLATGGGGPEWTGDGASAGLAATGGGACVLIGASAGAGEGAGATAAGGGAGDSAGTPLTSWLAAPDGGFTATRRRNESMGSARSAGLALTATAGDAGVIWFGSLMPPLGAPLPATSGGGAYAGAGVVAVATGGGGAANVGGGTAAYGCGGGGMAAGAAAAGGGAELLKVISMPLISASMLAQSSSMAAAAIYDWERPAKKEPERPGASAHKARRPWRGT